MKIAISSMSDWLYDDVTPTHFLWLPTNADREQIKKAREFISKNNDVEMISLHSKGRIECRTGKNPWEYSDTCFIHVYPSVVYLYVRSGYDHDTHVRSISMNNDILKIH